MWVRKRQTHNSGGEGRKYRNSEMRQIIRGSLTLSNTNLLAIKPQTFGYK